MRAWTKLCAAALGLPQSSEPAGASRPWKLRAPLRASLGALAGAGLLAAAGGLSCGPNVSTLPGEGGGQIVALLVSPSNEVLQIDLGQRKSQRLTALGVLPDGSSVDVSERARWSVEDPFVGDITVQPGEGGGVTFQSAARSSVQVGFAKISAQLGESAELRSYGQLTLVWLRQSGPAQDFFFQLPYAPGAAPETRPLSLSTYVQSLDAFLAVDTTGSMGPSISQLTSALSRTIIPGVQAAAIKDAWFGVGAVEDFPAVPFGERSCYSDGTEDDQPFILLSPMDPSAAKASIAVQKLMRPSMVGNVPRGCGGDVPEAQIEALYQLATGAGLQAGATIPPYRGTGRGGAGFREGALPVITLLTDASFHVKGEAGRTCPTTNPNGTPRNDSTAYVGAIANSAHSRTETMSALGGLCAKVIGVAPQLAAAEECLPNRDLVETARATGAVVPPAAWDSAATGRPAGCGAQQCCTGLNGAGEAPGPDGQCPLVFKVGASGQGLGTQVVQGITNLVRFASFDVSIDKRGQTSGDLGATLPPGRTTADFITEVTPDSAVAPPGPPVLPTPRISTDGKGFTAVVPGSSLSFRVSVRNDFVPATSQPQFFRATLRIRAGGCADLDEREVLILVPPVAPHVG